MDKVKKIRKGKYEYKEYVIVNCGYHQPDHCIWWEASYINSGEVICHAKTKREIIKMLDKKSNEI